VEISGNILHPSIPAEAITAVADLGTGTGYVKFLSYPMLLPFSLPRRTAKQGIEIKAPKEPSCTTQNLSYADPPQNMA
jgi:hypothetical protein